MTDIAKNLGADWYRHQQSYFDYLLEEKERERLAHDAKTQGVRFFLTKTS